METEVKLYQLKHKKTGLFYCQSTSCLSEIGTLYTTDKIDKPKNNTQIKITNKKLLEKKKDLFKKIGIIGQYNYKGIPTLWYDYANETDFEVQELK